MKKYISAWLLASLLLLTVAHAQQDSVPRSPLCSALSHFEVQAGFNATDFIKAFLSFNTTTPLGTPFDFNAKLFFKHDNMKTGLRAGFGYSDQYSGRDVDTLSPGARTTYDFGSLFRIGIEHQHSIARRWVVYGGLDYLNMTTNSEVTNVYATGAGTTAGLYLATQQVNTGASGWGPVLGIQFLVTKHLVLSTEAAYYAIYSQGITRNIDNYTNPTISQYYKVSQFGTVSKANTFVMPAFINVNVVF